MQVVVSDPAAELIAEHGGRVYVWLKKGRCCSGVTTLTAAWEPKPDTAFRRVEATDRFELYLPSRLGRLPDELHLDLRRFPRRVEAYWDGCAWVP